MSPAYGYVLAWCFIDTLAASDKIAPPSDDIEPWSIYTVSRKNGVTVFDYKSGISWAIFTIFVPVETWINILQRIITTSP